jgi:hypothetical protein
MPLWLFLLFLLAVWAVLSLFRYLQSSRLVAGQSSAQPKSVQEKWQIPDDLANASIPRRLRLRASSWFLLGVGFGFLAFAVAIAVFVYASGALIAEQPATLLVISLPLLFSAGPGLIIMWLIWRECRLLSKGHIAGAVVTGSYTVRNGLVLNYRFADKAGCEHAGSSIFVGKVAPQLGATVTVINDPHNPRRNTLYPNPMARLLTARAQ